MTTGGISFRGAGFGPLLAGQKAYVKAQGTRSKFGLMVPEAFVRGIRDLIAVAPPLIITRAEIDQLFAAIRHVLDHLWD